MKYFYTLVMFFVSFSFCILTYFLDLKLFEKILEFLQTPEVLEISKFILPLLMILSGLACDIFKISYRKKVDLEKQKERLHIFKITMRTVQDIFLNFLNHLLLFVMEAEESQALDKDAIEKLKALIQKAAKTINQLADFTIVIEQDKNDDLQMIDMKKSS